MFTGICGDGDIQDVCQEYFDLSRDYEKIKKDLSKVDQYIKESISQGDITAGHGRALLTVSDDEKRDKLWKRIIAENLSVRETEKLASSAVSVKKKTPLKKRKSPDVV